MNLVLGRRSLYQSDEGSSMGTPELVFVLT